MLQEGNELIPFHKVSECTEPHSVQSEHSCILAKDRMLPPVFTPGPLTNPGQIMCQGIMHGEYNELGTVPSPPCPVVMQLINLGTETPRARASDSGYMP